MRMSRGDRNLRLGVLQMRAFFCVKCFTVECVINRRVSDSIRVITQYGNVDVGVVRFWSVVKL